jgi:hypothetical protein
MPVEVTTKLLPPGRCPPSAGPPGCRALPPGRSSLGELDWRPEGPRRASEGLVLAHSVVGPGVLHGGSVVIFAVFPYPDKPIGGYATISGDMTTGRGVWGR